MVSLIAECSSRATKKRRTRSTYSGVDFNHSAASSIVLSVMSEGIGKDTVGEKCARTLHHLIHDIYLSLSDTTGTVVPSLI